MNHITREELIQKIKHLQPLPQVTIKVISLIDDPESNIEDLKKEILKDQALTANILKVCNSSYYGFVRKITNLSNAIVLIGTKAIRNIILSATFRNHYNREVAGYSLERGELAKHSISCALAAELIAEEIKFQDKETAFIAALLHDIGKLVIDQYIQDQFRVIIERVRQEKKSFFQIEKEELCFGHAEIGGMMAEAWKFPLALVDAIRFHHSPLESKTNLPLASIVHLANIITLMLGIGCGADGLASDLDSRALETLALGENDIELIISKMPEKLQLLRELQ